MAQKTEDMPQLSTSHIDKYQKGSRERNPPNLDGEKLEGIP